MRSIAWALCALPILTAAQYGGGPAPSPASTGPVPAPSAPADTPGHVNIDVAFNETFTFHPQSVTAGVGTIVTFWFPNTGLNHSVTQSSFDAPCTYLAASGSNPAGFDSGLQSFVKFSINITDTQPIWFHCKQLLHCGMGMVGSINAPTSGNNTYDAFLAAAMKIGPGEVTENDQGPKTGGVHGNATAPPVDSTAGATKITVSALAMFAGGLAIALI